MSDLLAALFDEPEPDDDLGRVLHELRWLVLRHPAAAQAAVTALVREGKQFAGTDEGRAWRERLAGSELVRRGQALWELATFRALDGRDGDMLPSQLVDAFCRAAARADLEVALAKAHE